MHALCGHAPVNSQVQVPTSCSQKQSWEVPVLASSHIVILMQMEREVPLPNVCLSVAACLTVMIIIRNLEQISQEIYMLVPI